MLCWWGPTSPKQLSRAVHLFSLGITLSNTFMLPLESLSSEEVNLKDVSVAICLQTCTVWCWWLNTLYLQSFVDIAYTDTCDPIIMYCLGLFVVVHSKQWCLRTKTYDQFLPVMDMLFRYAAEEGERWTKLPIIAPYIYDAGHPYIRSTIALYRDDTGYAHTFEICIFHFQLFYHIHISLIRIVKKLKLLWERLDTVIMILHSSLSTQFNRTSLTASDVALAEIRRFVFRASYDSAHAQ